MTGANPRPPPAVGGRSPLARQVPGRRSGIESRLPGGLCGHTTGGGVTAKARRTGREPLDVAIETYLDMQRGSEGYEWGGPTYVIDTDGTLCQLAEETTRTSHIGSIMAVGGERVDRRVQYLTGEWRSLCSRAAVAAWEHAWPGYRSPQHLFPVPRPNEYYIGCELIPCGDGFGTPWTARAPSLRFSEKQHRAFVALAVDVATRWRWPDEWWSSPRLVAHEDVGLIDRHDAGGGWDWGALRPMDPYVDFRLIRNECARAERAKRKEGEV